MNIIQDAPRISGDVMSYLFDRAGALERLAKYEAEWGGDPITRQKKQMDAYRAAHGMTPSPMPTATNATNSASPSAGPAPAPDQHAPVTAAATTAAAPPQAGNAQEVAD